MTPAADDICHGRTGHVRAAPSLRSGASAGASTSAKVPNEAWLASQPLDHQITLWGQCRLGSPSIGVTLAWRRESPCAFGAGRGYYRRRGRAHRDRPLVHCRGHRPGTGGYGLRVMPAAPSRGPSARRAWPQQARLGRRRRLPLAGRPNLVRAPHVRHRAHPGRPAPRRRRTRLPMASLVQRLVRVPRRTRSTSSSIPPGCPGTPSGSRSSSRFIATPS